MSADALAPLLVIVALALVVWVVAAPLRGGPRSVEGEEAAERDRLHAARDATYAQIRELELDARTGKVSDEEFRAEDRRLRGEAVGILRQLDALD